MAVNDEHPPPRHDPHLEPGAEPGHEQGQLPYAEGELLPPSAPAPEPEPDASEQVRLWTTDRLQELIRNLQPYTDGTLGEISPRHTQARLAAIRELNRLWQAHILPEPVGQELGPSEEEQAAELEELQEAIREQVRAELEAEQAEAARLETEQRELLALEAQERARQRVLEGIGELRRRAPGTGPDQPPTASPSPPQAGAGT